MAASAEWEVRCWGDSPAQCQAEDVVMANIKRSSPPPPPPPPQLPPQLHQSHQGSIANPPTSPLNPFTAYLNTITAWHARVADMVRFITAQPRTASTSFSSSSTSSAHCESTQSQLPIPDRLPAQARNGNADKPAKKLPIALLPTGYALTLSDRSACSVPIADAYTPVDHWQWMATLWRGVAGPDLVVYVRPSLLPSPGFRAAGVAGGSGGGGYLAAEERGVAGVEVKSAGLIVVKVPVPVGVPFDGEVAVDEKMERRLGFEVVEWVRGGGGGHSG
ncbi:hypothetical protein MMYC01_201193 [Madurella mycetomatis]|uniref:Uncharacterized protein n=1 Tax=Madurella mycetomatis TaxID=100816 RepID=A0A175WFX7_9PEZI|nr:hypothetical protein MMYC01_201193 [Madurella mycetomatis]